MNVVLKLFKRYKLGDVEFFVMNVVKYRDIERVEVCYDGMCNVLRGSIIFLWNSVLIMFRMFKIRYEILSWESWLYRIELAQDRDWWVFGFY